MDNWKLSVIEQDHAFVEDRKRFYQNHYRVSEPIDPWHAYAQKIVHSTTRDWFATLGKGGRILNAGSGGSDYGISTPMVHLDLVADRINCFDEFVIGDVSHIPTDSGSFDVVLCVGSVLNYANPILSIGEFERVLRPGGLLILEYERSASPEYWRAHGRSSPCVRVKSFYGSQTTQLWVYGDEFINGLLAINGFSKLKETRFHGISSVVLAITGSPCTAARCVWGDHFTANLWPIRNITSNRLLAVEKFTK
jgi:SAM-dependent methyltransferase